MYRAAILALVLSGSLTGTALAGDVSTGFYSPTRNIVCGFPEPGQPAFVCELMEASWTAPPVEKDCPLDEFRQVVMRTEGRAGAQMDCRGDTWLTPDMEVLAYGATWSHMGITCESARTGVTCRNRSGNGWTVNRRAAKLF